MKFVFTDKKINCPTRSTPTREKKVGKLDRYCKADTEAAMVFSGEKGRNNVELTIRSGGTIIRVAESTSDMFATMTPPSPRWSAGSAGTRPGWKSACGRMRSPAAWTQRKSPPSPL